MAAEKRIEKAVQWAQQTYHGDLQQFFQDAIHWEQTGEVRRLTVNSTPKPPVRTARGNASGG